MLEMVLAKKRLGEGRVSCMFHLAVKQNVEISHLDLCKGVVQSIEDLNHKNMVF